MSLGFYNKKRINLGRHNRFFQRVFKQSTSFATTLTVSDTFNGVLDTNLTSHTADTGHTWASSIGGFGKLDGQTPKGMYPNNSGSQTLKSSYTPPDANYAVEIDVILLTSFSMDTSCGVYARHTSGVETGYLFDYRYNVGGSNVKQFRLFYANAGTFTPIGSPSTFDQNIGTGTAVRLRLEVNGTSIKGYVDGVLKCSATDSNISSAGLVAIRTSGTAMTSSTGYHLRNFAVKE
jgi:hypothetical protein